VSSALALVVAAAFAAPGAAQPFTFTRIAREFAHGNLLGFVDITVRPALAENGTVVFGGYTLGNFITPDRTDRLFAGNGGAITAIELLSAGYTHLREVAVDSAGAIAFTARRMVGGSTFQGVYRTSTSAAPIALLYEGNVILDPLQPPAQSAVALADNGTVAFSSVVNGNGAVYRGPVAGPVAPLRTANGTFFNTRGAAVNGAGTVAMEFEYSDPTLGLTRGILLFTAPGQALADVSTAIEKAGIAFSPRYAMNASGQVAFAINASATMRFYDPPDDAGGTLIATITLTPGVYVATPKPFGLPVSVTQVAGPAAYDLFGDVSINAAGAVAFEASAVGDPNFGVFTGPDPIADKILQQGDRVNGGPIISVVVMGNLNDAGQLSLLTSEFGGDRDIWRVAGVAPPPSPPPLAFARVAHRNRPTGVAFYEPTRSLMTAVNAPTGLPFSLESVAADGVRARFSALQGLSDEPVVATVKRGRNPANFPADAVFAGHLSRVTDGGATVHHPWVLFSDQRVMGMHVDETGVFGGELLVATMAINVGSGGVVGLRPTGLPRPYFAFERPGGLVTVPADARYGPLAGKCVVCATDERRLYSFAPGGLLASVPIPFPARDVDLIPSDQALYAVDAGSNQIVAVPGPEFDGMAGDLLLTRATSAPGTSGLYRAWWDGSELRTEALGRRAGSPDVLRWNQVTFAPVGVRPLPDCVTDAPAMGTVGVPIAFHVTGRDGDPTDLVRLTVTGLPGGATLDPPLPALGNPVATECRWTPTLAQVGVHAIVFTATDRGGLTTRCAVRIEIAECYLFLGVQSVDHGLGGEDRLYTLPLAFWPVTMEDVPSFRIPNDPGLRGVEVFEQVAMWNPTMFPRDPLQMSNGLAVVLGGTAAEYGLDSGIKLFALGPPALGSTFRVGFRILGM
jgi:hypothetical protein